MKPVWTIYLDGERGPTFTILEHAIEAMTEDLSEAKPGEVMEIRCEEMTQAAIDEMYAKPEWGGW